jgi:hypothetical protein
MSVDPGEQVHAGRLVRRLPWAHQHVPTLGQLEAERAQSPRSDAAQAEFERGDHDASLSPGDVLAILAHNMNQAMTDPSTEPG